ncbi:hypothetical protein L249_2075 [Ophiocordyceps polyrhachis-furcata BCC 54312]|uniref:Lytic polysaccharide monooxygenase n=1 Tax=Ophiocordyceps polyrhachis-furcata BCC 54312 TaxID=1330021 RepID=A0A367LNU3_9HYPO|nr:hypothetical protein L249_2075 [Ophiocordyceps polyrhachis-furcata BCC 54312]
MLFKTISAAGLVATGSAHILISNPVPFGKASLNNSPLAADGSDFPCKQRNGVYDSAGASNVYKQGSTQQLEFRGSAVHGGGSCQVSMTTDLKPSKNSVWKVIKSIEGGCPAKNQGGNMGGGAGADTPFKYDYTIHNEIPAGNYTLAWTWFNKIGNREMYMNCAPVTVTGSGGSQGYLQSLPDMFVANVGKGCGTEGGKDVVFPNPGKDVDRFNGQTSAFAAPTGSCPQGSGGQGGGDGSGGYQPAPTPTAQPTAPAEKPSYNNKSVASNEYTAPKPSSPSYGGSRSGPSSNQYAAPEPSSAVKSSYQSNVPGAVFATVSADNAAATNAPASGGSSSTPQGQQQDQQQQQQQQQQQVSAPSNGTAPGGTHPAGSSCSSEGTWNCVGGNSFQRCASGQWSVVQAMSEGTSCKPGEAAELNMARSLARRIVGRPFRHYAA